MIAALALACTACTPTPVPPVEPLLTACSVTDGDTLRCGEERVRLLAIDAPELAGHCRPGRDCVEGDPLAATAALEAAVEGRALTIARFGQDRYGRTLAVVYADGASTSCAMIASGNAEYVSKWDRNGYVARECKLR